MVLQCPLERISVRAWLLWTEAQRRGTRGGEEVPAVERRDVWELIQINHIASQLRLRLTQFKHANPISQPTHLWFPVTRTDGGTAVETTTTSVAGVVALLGSSGSRTLPRITRRPA